ncbi:MAG: hypothetical protein AAFX93_17980 [Verrucomicrobiota bacterium]
MGLFSIVTKPIGCILTLIGGIVVVLILMVVGFFWAIDTMAPQLAEEIVTEATGFPTTINDASVNFRNQSLTFEGVEIDNPSDYPDQEFLRISEFTIGLDRDNSSEQNLVISEITLAIEELAFLQGNMSTSNLEAFFESAEVNWDQILSQVAEEAASRDQMVPEKLLVNQLNLSIDRIKMVDTSGPETIYRALDLGYSESFEKVTEIRPVLQAISNEFVSKGLFEIAEPIQEVIKDSQN